jgi:hypothetical protein
MAPVKKPAHTPAPKSPTPNADTSSESSFDSKHSYGSRYISSLDGENSGNSAARPPSTTGLTGNTSSKRAREENSGDMDASTSAGASASKRPRSASPQRAMPSTAEQAALREENKALRAQHAQLEATKKAQQAELVAAKAEHAAMRATEQPLVEKLIREMRKSELMLRPPAVLAAGSITESDAALRQNLHTQIQMTRTQNQEAKAMANASVAIGLFLGSTGLSTDNSANPLTATIKKLVSMHTVQPETPATRTAAIGKVIKIIIAEYHGITTPKTLLALDKANKENTITAEEKTQLQSESKKLKTRLQGKKIIEDRMMSMVENKERFVQAQAALETKLAEYSFIIQAQQQNIQPFIKQFKTMLLVYFQMNSKREPIGAAQQQARLQIKNAAEAKLKEHLGEGHNYRIMLAVSSIFNTVTGDFVSPGEPENVADITEAHITKHANYIMGLAGHTTRIESEPEPEAPSAAAAEDSKKP